MTSISSSLQPLSSRLRYQTAQSCCQYSQHILSPVLLCQRMRIHIQNLKFHRSHSSASKCLLCLSWNGNGFVFCFLNALLHKTCPLKDRSWPWVTFSNALLLSDHYRVRSQEQIKEYINKRMNTTQIKSPNTFHVDSKSSIQGDPPKVIWFFSCILTIIHGSLKCL